MPEPPRKALKASRNLNQNLLGHEICLNWFVCVLCCKFTILEIHSTLIPTSAGCSESNTTFPFLSGENGEAKHDGLYKAFYMQERLEH